MPEDKREGFSVPAVANGIKKMRTGIDFAKGYLLRK